MVRRYFAIMVCLALAVLLPGRGVLAAGKRVALVVGNGGYASAPLKNPVNDAEDVAGALTGLGFEVIKVQNASKREMIAAIDRFHERIKSVDLALFYYAGHGMQIRGRNYLIPVDAHVTTESDVELESVDAARVLGKMESARSRANVVILDACRDNPFARSFRTEEKGLAKMDAPIGSLIAYATAPGSVAADGPGRNGIFTQNLLANLGRPGLSIQDVLMETRRAVLRDTTNKQVPWESSSLTDRIYLAEGKAELKADNPAVPQPAPPPPPAPKPVPMSSPESVAAKTEHKIGDTWTEPTTGMEFVWVPGGCFQIGSNDGESSEKPMHEVCVDAYWMGKYEVTQNQWQRVMGSNPSKFRKGGNYPVEQVSWIDAQNFIRKLNVGGSKLRLPTEAEWEYACRSGGRDETYAGGKFMEQVAWHDPNSGGETHLVGTKLRNNLGLHDMSGNVWEWVEDTYSRTAYSEYKRINPLSTQGSAIRILRGGSWYSGPNDVRCSKRFGVEPSGLSFGFGFRLARTAEP